MDEVRQAAEEQISASHSEARAIIDQLQEAAEALQQQVAEQAARAAALEGELAGLKVRWWVHWKGALAGVKVTWWQLLRGAGRLKVNCRLHWKGSWLGTRSSGGCPEGGVGWAEDLMVAASLNMGWPSWRRLCY